MILIYCKKTSNYTSVCVREYDILLNFYFCESDLANFVDWISWWNLSVELINVDDKIKQSCTPTAQKTLCPFGRHNP